MLTHNSAAHAPASAQNPRPPLDPVRRMARFGPVQPLPQPRGWLERILFS